MTEHTLARKNDAGGFVFYVALSDMAVPGSFKANPTLAAGDAKVSIDGGAFANLGTLPDVDPNSGVAVKITLSQAEINGDNIQVTLIDQTATKEWCDLFVNLRPATRKLENLAFPNTSGNGMDVNATGGVEVGSFQADALTPAAIKNMGLGTVTTGATQTSVPTSAFLPAGAIADQFAERTMLFDDDTTTTTLRGCARKITASSNAANPTFTVEALPAAPASGDTFSVV